MDGGMRMTYHVWGDDWPHWDKLDKAQDFIYEYANRRGLKLFMKEKWGTIRYQFTFLSFFNDHAPIHRLYYGPRIYTPSPIILKKIDRVIGKLLYYIGIIPLIWKYQRFIFKRAIFKAVEKFPEIEDEILCDAPEEIVGEKIHRKYWN